MNYGSNRGFTPNSMLNNSSNGFRGRGRARWSSNCGGFNSRGGGAGRGTAKFPSDNRPGDLDILERLDKSSQPALLPIPEDQDLTSSVIAIQNTEYIGSYQWVDIKDPTIIVPGTSLAVLYHCNTCSHMPIRVPGSMGV